MVGHSFQERSAILYFYLLHFHVSCWERCVETDGRNTSLSGSTQCAVPFPRVNNFKAVVFKIFELIMCTM
jgi:hypothetical protein